MLKRFLITCTWFCLCGSLWPAMTVAEPRIADAVYEQNGAREEQRELFMKAEYAAGRGRLAEYQQLLEQLQDYPLLPYLELERLQQVGYLANEQRVLDFLETYQNTPMDWQLRRPWLDYLASKGEKARFLRDFKAPGSMTHQCLYLRYQLDLETIPRAAVMRAVDQLWQTGASLPKTCDPLLATWSAEGHRTTELVWARIRLAAEGGKHTLLPYLESLLPAEMQYLAEHYYRVRRDPSQLVRLQHLRGYYPRHEADIVTYGLGRLIWRDPDRALRVIAKLPEHIRFSTEQRIEIEQDFAVALSAKDHDQAHIWLNRLAPNEHNASSLQWLLAEWVREGQWRKIIEFMGQSNVAQQTTAWQYWHARALAETGAESVARQHYAALAGQRHYYGFLAAAQVQTPLSLEQKPIVATAAALGALRDQPAVSRTYEFLKLGRYLDARREWFTLLEQLQGSELELLAVLADQWGWHDQAIYALASIGEFDAVELRFPKAYLAEHTAFANESGIDVNWALAISRRESAFRHDANSHAGAYGLMQILPSTARYIEKRRVSRQELLDAGTNIRLGTKYLAELQTRLQDNWMLATAAYNGGIYRVLEWLPEEPLEADRWIETIPFKETRDYVKNVIAYQQIYRTLDDDSRSLFEQLLPMQISRQGANSHD